MPSASGIGADRDVCSNRSTGSSFEPRAYDVQVLASIASRTELRAVLDRRVAIIDLKDVDEGALGAARAIELAAVRKELDQMSSDRGEPFELSASVGDVSASTPSGPVVLAAVGAARLGALWVKIGIGALDSSAGAQKLLRSVRRALDATCPGTRLVAAGYADAERFGGLPPRAVLEVAAESRCDGFLLDTRAKNGTGLFDHRSIPELEELVDAAHDLGLGIALAGAIGERHLEALAKISPDWIGVRSALCESDRRGPVSSERVQSFLAAVDRVRAR